MNDIFEFLDELHNLKALYNEGELRNIDFEILIQKYEKIVSEFEKDLEEQFQAFQYQLDAESFYDPRGDF